METNNINNVKQVIVVRKDLHMRKGKIAAQVAHASMKVLLDKMKKQKWGPWLDFRMVVNDKEPLYDWLNERFTKIVVYCNMESEIYEVEVECINNGIPYAVIVDSGATEFDGVPTKTCIAVGPYWSEDIDKITGKFKLL